MRTYLWKSLLAMLITATGTTSFAKESFRCGEYEVKGVIRAQGTQNVLKLYEGSMSETILVLDKKLHEKAFAHMDSAVSLTGIIATPIEKYRGQIQSLAVSNENSIKPRTADPLHPKLDSGLKLISAFNCANSSKKK